MISMACLHKNPPGRPLGIISAINGEEMKAGENCGKHIDRCQACGQLRDMQINLGEYDIELIIEALTTAASRHETYSRFRPESPSRDQHNRKAEHMRALRTRLVEEV